MLTAAVELSTVMPAAVERVVVVAAELSVVMTAAVGSVVVVVEVLLRSRGLQIAALFAFITGVVHLTGNTAVQNA